jgi:hypothetical protein
MLSPVICDIEVNFMKKNVFSQFYRKLSFSLYITACTSSRIYNGYSLFFLLSLQVEAYKAEVALKKVKRHPSLVAEKITVPDVEMKKASFEKTKGSHGDMEKSTDQVSTSCISTKEADTNTSIGRPLNW